MKRYLIFIGPVFYPGQGFDDFEGSFDTIDECIKKIKELDSSMQEESEYDENETEINKLCGPNYWGQIVDSQTSKVVMLFYS